MDLYYEDGTTPSDDILANFLRICDEEAIVAVHCKVCFLIHDLLFEERERERDYDISF